MTLSVTYHTMVSCGFYAIAYATGVPYPDALLDERRVGYPLDKAASYLMGLLQLFDVGFTAPIRIDAL